MERPADAWRPWWRAAFFDPSPDPRLTFFRFAFVIASAAHLWLADPWRVDAWLPANLVYLAGILLVAWRGAAAGFALCAVGAAIPILWHHDQLTQSVLLCLLALGGAWFTARHRPEGALATARLLTVATYALATFHKLNADFLDPQFSCAVYGGGKVADYWDLPALVPGGLLIALVLVVELAIALLHIVGLRWLAWPLAVAFHIPLTLTMAPAFAFVMLAAHAGFVTRDDLRMWRQMGSTLGWLVLPAGLVTAASLWRHGGWPEWGMVPKEWLLWWLLMALSIGLWRRRRSLATDLRLPRRAPAGAAVLTAVFLVSGLSPYTGLQYQHAAAMLSNLRVDTGCWNHVVVPESVRLTDDYIRIDDASLGREGAIPEYEALLEDHLWGPTLLAYTARNWCQPAVRPLRIEGSFRGQPFVVDDVCDGLGPQLQPATTGGLLRFQKSLLRACPQACIH